MKYKIGKILDLGWGFFAISEKFFPIVEYKVLK